MFCGPSGGGKVIEGINLCPDPKFAPADLKKLHTHDLFSLARQIEDRSSKLPSVIRQACQQLNDYYMSTRYPDVHEAVGEYTRELANEALNLALAVFRFAKFENK